MTDRPAPANGPPIIALRNAAFGYGERRIVADVSLEIRAGEVVAVLGPNGSGKSTLVRGLLGLTDHLDGEADLWGEPLSQFTERGRIGYVPQRHSLSTSVRATVAEIVMIGRLRFRSWWHPLRRPPGDADRQAVARALDIVGLGERAGSDVSHLSGGQQRRVLIARALASMPEVLLMDEPTAGVDAASQAVLAGVLARLAAEGKTLLVVTHELAALADVVTRVVVVTNGGVSFDGSPAAYRDDRRPLDRIPLSAAGID